MSKIYLLILTIFIFAGCVYKEPEIASINNKAVMHPLPPAVVKATPSQNSTPQALPSKPQTAQNSNIISLPTIKGNMVKVDASGYDIKFLDNTYGGKDVLIVLFGYDCPHCIRQLPAIKQLANNPRLKVLGIHAKSMIGDDRLRSYMRRSGINFDVLSFKNDIKLIRFLRNAGYYDDSVPCDVLVHKDGKVEVVNEGDVLSKL